jgi:hypothetical protein
MQAKCVLTSWSISELKHHPEVLKRNPHIQAKCTLYMTGLSGFGFMMSWYGLLLAYSTEAGL